MAEHLMQLSSSELLVLASVDRVKAFNTKDVLGKNCAYVGAKYSSQYLHLNKMCETTRNLLEILDQPVFESLL